MKKVICFFIIFMILIIFSDFILYLSGINRYMKERGLKEAPFSYYDGYKNIYKNNNIFDLYGYKNLEQLECNGENNCQGKFRMPDGVNYVKKPIILFGGSFSHGNLLKQNQIFSYKLSKQLKRPVINRAVQGYGLNLMYIQALDDYFYQSVPKADTVIYVMMLDHYRRMLSHKFDPVDSNFYLHFEYDVKNKNLNQKIYKNKLINLIKMSYIYSFFEANRISEYINNPKNADEITENAVLYFIKTKEELEKHWNNKINFIVIIYDDYQVDYQDLLREKLIKNGFKAIFISDLTKSDLTTEKYKSNDGHPTEDAWELLTPLIIKEAGL